MKNYSRKILSMAISLMMVLSMASIPAMAADLGDAYKSEGIADVNYTSNNRLTLEQFETWYGTAQHAAVETFESSTDADLASKKSITFNIPIDEENNDEYKLMLSGQNTNAQYQVIANSTAGKWSSGSNALYIKNLGKGGCAFTLGELANNSNLKLVGFAWVLSCTGSSFTPTINVEYSNDGKDAIPVNLSKESAQFVGVKAPDGAYITKIDIPVSVTNVRHALVDDIALIFEEVAAPVAPESITVTGDETVAEPQYNASKTVQFSAVDQSSNPTAVTWSVEGSSAATIDEESGLLTLKRTEDTSIAGNVKVVATSKIDETKVGEKTITVTSAEPYFESTKMSDGSVTSYTKDEFVADLNNAVHKAVINFENSAEYTAGSGNISFSTAVSENGGTIAGELQAYDAENNKDTTDYSKKVSNGILRLPKRSGTDGYHAIELDKTALTGSIKPTAVGMMIGKTGDNALDCTLKIYLDNATEAITYNRVLAKEDAVTNYGFVGYKAPGGRYIEKIQMETSPSANFDDLCFIFEDPSAAPIKFSTNEAGTNLIGAISNLTGDIFINVAGRKTFADKKVLLALYGGDELLDVAMVDASETETVQAKASIPADKTLTKVKAFVWNFAGGLIPVQDDIEIDK